MIGSEPSHREGTSPVLPLRSKSVSSSPRTFPRADSDGLIRRVRFHLCRTFPRPPSLPASSSLRPNALRRSLRSSSRCRFGWSGLYSRAPRTTRVSDRHRYSSFPVWLIQFHSSDAHRMRSGRFPPRTPGKIGSRPVAMARDAGQSVLQGRLVPDASTRSRPSH